MSGICLMATSPSGMAVGAEADAWRARALPMIEEDPTRMPDFIGIGPEAPNDLAAERRFFGG
jgi:hypothetical protein